MPGQQSQRAARISDILSRELLRELADEQSFERGEEYCEDHPESLRERRGKVEATVLGTELYGVELWSNRGALAFSCNCPVGQEWAFCKHCVAVGLAWLERKPRKKSREPKPVTRDDVRRWLMGQPHETVVDLILEVAADDDGLEQRLLLGAAREARPESAIETYRRALDEAVSVRDFIDYRSAWDFAAGIDQVIDSIEELLQDGHAVDVIALAEHGLEAVEEAIGSVDDSDGSMGELLARLQRLHLRACQQAKPDSEELAERLFQWELYTDFDVFYGAMETYASLLGKKGLARYRTLAEAEWAKLPPLAPGDKGRYGERSRITSIMEALARSTGDVEALVAVKKHDLSLPYAYLEIAQIYREARKAERALEWAERGVKAFPADPDWRLQEFLADEYHRRKRHDDAMAIAWGHYAASPKLDRYKRLKAHADRAGKWPTWRAKALELLRQQVSGSKKGPSRDRRWASLLRRDHGELVRVLLWENDVEAAWQQAVEGGCNDRLWLELAAKREQDDPEDALPVYQRLVDPTIQQKNNDAYREAVRLLGKIRELMQRLGRQAEFPPYLATIRTAHKPKRNLMKLLDRQKWA